MHCVFMPNSQLCPALMAQYPFVMKRLCPFMTSPNSDGMGAFLSQESDLISWRLCLVGGFSMSD